MSSPAGQMSNAEVWRMLEKDLQERILERCADYPDVHVIRLDPSQRNQRSGDNNGFPDLQLVGPGGVLYRELKSMKGRANGLRSPQRVWRDLLIAAGQDWNIWTPADLAAGRVDAELAALAMPATEGVSDDARVNRAFALVMSRPLSPAAAAADDEEGSGHRVVTWGGAMSLLAGFVIGIICAGRD